ncbi:MAG: T9SS type A sorting domain-containing protein [Chitinophagaceae bacterium]|nr:T9SS type A sorting domain-containing protein [Chitinophagaceae bacterium]
MKLKFYPTLRLLMLMILSAFLVTESFSQCPGLTATYTATESRCIATGTLQINAAGGSGNYNYKVTGPTSTGFTSSNLITGLLPGTYVITVKDIVANCSIDLTNAIISGSYSDPRFALTQSDVTCFNGNDGVISATSLQYGRAPFSYTIVAPSPMAVGTSNSSGVFTGLIPGEYSVQLMDSCGGIQTRTISIQNYSWSITSASVTLSNCTVYNALINLIDNKGNTNASGSAFNGFEYGVVNSIGDTSWFASRSFSFDLLQKRTVTLVVKDRCGYIQSVNWTNTNIPSVFANATISAAVCSGFTATITGQANLTNPTYCIVDNVGNPVTGQPCNSSGVFTNLPYGSYCINITNTCYDTVITRCFTQAQATPNVTGAVTISNYTCTDVRATVTGQQNLTSPTYCLFDNLGNQVGLCNSTGVFNNVPYGSYSIEITDGCTGAVFTRTFDAVKRTRSVAANATVNGNTCSTFNATITGQTNLTSPQYCLVDNLGDPVPGFPCNTTGIFANLPYGAYCINITDACADTTIQRCVNVTRPVATLGATVVSARTCTGFTATISGEGNLYTGGVYCLLDNLGNPIVGVPCNTTGVFTNIPYGTYCVQQTDNCSGTVLTNCFTVTAPVPSVGPASITNRTCAGFRVTVTNQQNLTNPSFCLFDNLNNQIGACNSTGVFDVTGFGSFYITTTDGCAGDVFTTNFTVTKLVPSVGATVNFSNQNCTTFTADIIGETNLTSPHYYLKDNTGTVIADNMTGTFNNIIYGSYCIDVVNSCLDTTIERCFTVTGDSPAANITASPSCALNTADIAVQITGGYGPFVIDVYDAFNNLVRTTTTASNNVVLSAIPTLVIGQTFRIVVTGACGAPTTTFVTAQRSVFTRTPTVIPKCPSGTWANGSSDLQVIASTNLTSVNMSITEKNFTATTINYANNVGNTFTFTNLEPATYVITYTFAGCVQTTKDTIVVGPYQYPNLSQSAAYQCDNNSFSVGASVNGGVSPFTYEVIGSTPSFPSIISPAQASPLFTINNGIEYSLVRLRATDACGNATLNDVSILPLANTIVRASSQCWYNDITLTTDTVPNATYTWFKKTSATDSVLIGNTVGYNIPYMLPSDTGVYVSRMSVNSGCLTKISYFHLVPSCGFLLPVKITLNGKAINESANQLTWTAKDEQSVKRYIIERSNKQNGQFEIVGTVNSNQSVSSTYLFNDNSPQREGNFYRIKIEHATGKFSYSNMIVITSNVENTVSAYPNPVKDLLNINIRGSQNQNYRLSLYNNAGQIIYTATQLSIQSGTIKYRREAKAKPGLYFLQVNNLSTGESNTYKIIFE